MGRGIWEFYKLSFAVNPKAVKKKKVSLQNIKNYTHLSIPKPLSTITFHDFVTYHQDILTLERTILLDSQLSTISFVCIPKDWTCLETKANLFSGGK